MRAPVRRSRSSRRQAALVTTVSAVALTGLLAGCTGGTDTSGASTVGGGAPAGIASPVASTAPAPTASADLARGLLPADAFGAGATVVPVTPEQVQQQLSALPGGLAGVLAGIEVSPAPCASALKTVGATLTGVTGMAGEAARTGAGGTAEALVTGGAASTTADTVRTVVRACPTVRISSSHGTADVTLSTVDLPALGDDAAAVQATATLTPADRAPITLTALLGVVQDADRVVLLGTATPGGAAPDTTSFVSLLHRAVDTQSHAFG
jgi:hypothetical protein